jgi:hypothetical protein
VPWYSWNIAESGVKTPKIKIKSPHHEPSFLVVCQVLQTPVTRLSHLNRLSFINHYIKTFFSLKKYMSNFQHVPVDLSCKLFDSLIRSIILYNSEIWFIIKSPHHEPSFLVVCQVLQTPTEIISSVSVQRLLCLIPPCISTSSQLASVRESLRKLDFYMKKRTSHLGVFKIASSHRQTLWHGILSSTPCNVYESNSQLQ